MCAITVLRLIMVKRYRQRKPTLDETIRWENGYVLVMLAVGIHWSFMNYAVFFLLPADPFATTLITMMSAGVAAGAINALASHLRATYAVVAPLMLTLVVGLLNRGDSLHLTFSLMVLTYVFACVSFVRNSHRTLYDAVALRFDNQDLVAHLEQTKDRALVTLESIGDGVITTDVSGLIDYLNPAAESLTGWSLNEARGRVLSDVFNVVDEKTDAKLEALVDRCLREGQTGSRSNESEMLLHRDGSRRAIEESVAPIKDRAGNTIGVLLAFRDVTSQRAFSQHISYQANHDPLTGLVNRREFQNQLERALGRTRDGRTAHALCYVDLDRFKIVNDTCGHAAGDALLCQIAECLQTTIRKNDCVARLGGDEFTVLLENCDIEKARHIMEGVRRAIGEIKFTWNDMQYQVGASIGIVPVTAASGGVKEVMTSADKACYAAKDRGRDCVYVADTIAGTQRKQA
jgi:diguanylate cyclase (GGDEF)-like protein/PAS domain S-box-containing protein